MNEEELESFYQICLSKINEFDSPINSNKLLQLQTIFDSC